MTRTYPWSPQWLAGARLVREIGRPEHASTEQLSALLDDRAEPGERWHLNTHVDGCEQCASELNGLRSVQVLLRALPVHLPPRDFTIPVTAARPAPRQSRLLPLTRTLGALAAVLCVVFFSADALMLGSSSPKQFQSAADALLVTNATRVDSEDRVMRSAAESTAQATGRPGGAAGASAGGQAAYPTPAAAAPAAPAPAQPQPKAAAAPAKPAEAAKPADPAKPAAGQPAAAAKPAATVPPRVTSAAIAAPPQAPTGTGSSIAPPPAAARADMPVYLFGVEVTPLRVGGLILGLIAAVLFFCSAVISRSARAA
jgi:hypothetical protein